MRATIAAARLRLLDGDKAKAIEILHSIPVETVNALPVEDVREYDRTLTDASDATFLGYCPCGARLANHADWSEYFPALKPIQCRCGREHRVIHQAAQSGAGGKGSA